MEATAIQNVKSLNRGACFYYQEAGEAQYVLSWIGEDPIGVSSYRQGSKFKVMEIKLLDGNFDVKKCTDILGVQIEI